MKKISHLLPLVLIILGSGLLGACATSKQQSTAYYDLGSTRTAQAAAPAAALPPLAIAEINAPAWLDSPMMYYRLSYANDQEPRPYADSRWNTPPAQLFAQRLKSRIGQAGGAVLSASDGATNVPVVRIETDEFMQRFDSPGQSSAQVTMRVAVLNNRLLVAHRTFSRQVAAQSADAAGGVRALSEASDVAIADIIAWLAGLPLKK
jgi:cholesterol transport system auxiliary component